MPHRIRALEIELDPTSGEVRRGEELLVLPGRAVEILAVLVERPGELVSRDAIGLAVWNGTHVDLDRSLNLYISLLRKAFGDDARAPRYIETVPRRGYRFIAPVETPSDDAETRARILVLPFESLDGRESEALSDGMTDELILHLGRFASEGLEVIARTTASSYKRTTKSAAEIARERGATHLVEGSVRRLDDDLRIVARLVRARDEAVIWSHVFQETSPRLLSVQSRLARAMATEILIQLAPRSPAAPGGVPGEARDLYLKGRHIFFNPQHAPNQRALELFERSVAVAPDFAAPRRMLIEALLLAASNGSIAVRDVRATIERHRERVLALEPEAPESLACDVFVRAALELSWKGVARDVGRALDMGPSVDCLRICGIVLVVLGRFEEGLAALVRAVEADPLSLHTAFVAGWAFHRARRYVEAIERLEKTVAIDPTGPTGSLYLADSYLHEGNVDRAVELFSRRFEQGPMPPMVFAYGASILVRAGREEDARELVAKMEAVSRSRSVDPYFLAAAHASLGEIDGAFNFLERAARERSCLMSLAGIDSFLDPLRGHSRFQEILSGAVLF